jgi:hypothetical protein
MDTSTCAKDAASAAYLKLVQSTNDLDKSVRELTPNDLSLSEAQGVAVSVGKVINQLKQLKAYLNTTGFKPPKWHYHYQFS